MTDNNTSKTPAIDQAAILLQTIASALDKYDELQAQIAKEMHEQAVAFLNSPTTESADELAGVHGLVAQLQEYLHTSNGDSAAENEDAHITGMYQLTLQSYDQAETFASDLHKKVNTILGYDEDDEDIDGDDDLDFED